MRFLQATGTRRAALALAAVATLLTAGCSDASPGVVAYVGKTEISQKQVETAVAAVSTTVEQGQTVSTDAVVSAMIHGALAQQIAADKDITITDTDREAFVRSSNLAPLLKVPGAIPVAFDVADEQIVAKKLGAAPFLAEIERRSVKLNPRYGVLDPKQKTIVSNESGSLSKPSSNQTP
jgi:hypothetical protein